MKPRLLLIAIAALILPHSASADDAATYLSVTRDEKPVLTLRISPKSLAFLAENPSQITAILRERGVDCCFSQIRISEGVWRCCHGKFVITATSPSVQNVLVAAFNAPPISGR